MGPIEEMRPEQLKDLERRIAARRRELTESGGSWRSSLLWSVCALAAFFALDGLVFHSGWYMAYLQPQSSAGQLESRIFWLRHEAEVPETAVLGDSRIGEGFSARAAQTATGGAMRFRNIAVAGSTARVWYYLLRGADPERKRFPIVVLAMDRYSDQDGEDQRDRMGDLNYVVGRLRLTDCPEFALSYHTEAFRWRALSGCLFRGIPLREDVQELLANPAERFRVAKDWRNNGHGYLDGYGGKDEDLTGLTVDYAARTVQFPAGATQGQKDTVRNTLLPQPVPQTGMQREYRAKWLGKILDFYAGSKTRIVFIQMPRGPVPPPESKVPAYFVDSLKANPQVRVLTAETFRDLEQPELFADGLHLNHKGRPLFSERLAKKLMEPGQ